MAEMFQLSSLFAGNSEEEKLNEQYSYLFAAKQNKTILTGVVRAQELHRLGDSQVRCFVVDLGYGIRGLIPQPHTVATKTRDFGRYIGREVQFMILEIDRTNNLAVGSQTEAFLKLKEIALKNIEVGTRLNAEITHVAEGSLIVNFIGFEFTFFREHLYLIQNDLRQIYSVGDVIPIEVTQVDRESQTFESKAAVADKYSLIGTQYKIHDYYVGKVKTRITTGFIVELEYGLIVFCPFPTNWIHELPAPNDLVKVQLRRYDSKAKRLFGVIKASVKTKV